MFVRKIYDLKTGDLLAQGTIKECAEQMGKAEITIKRIIQTCRDGLSTKYTVECSQIQNVPRIDDPSISPCKYCYKKESCNRAAYQCTAFEKYFRFQFGELKKVFANVEWVKEEAHC